MSNKTIKLKTEQAKNIRIDKFLVSELEDITRSKIQYLIKNGYVLLNDSVITDPSYKIKEGDEFVVEIPSAKPTYIKPKDIDLDIVYEDKFLVVINKPAGLVTHPGAGNYDNTLVNGLIAHFKENLSSIAGETRPGIVHRLDKNTSGLLLIAKDDHTHALLSEDLKERNIKRVYHAVIRGRPNKMSGVIETNIGRNKNDRKKMGVLKEGGKFAVTHYKVLKTFLGGAFSLVECSLETGRTHQIRVHFCHIGHPIVGDPEYGSAKVTKSFKLDDYVMDHVKSIKRQMLHAKKLSFEHPITKEECSFEIDLPKDMEELISVLCR